MAPPKFRDRFQRTEPRSLAKTDRQKPWPRLGNHQGSGHVAR